MQLVELIQSGQHIEISLAGQRDHEVDQPLSVDLQEWVFNVYFSVVKFWLSSHICLFRLVSSQLIDASCRQRVSAAAASLVQPRHVILSVRVA
ncbi:hypothetical protein EYF80_005402 [Liparis tanakae]|uniref:Uncharacterized protein n=1 Tax=Liparis tanakae TaxID=230148 RepID=A0A4Z2J2G7_9TELE|nr:hypothetical protein EYF80_005402 [Liparis tanakae]